MRFHPLTLFSLIFASTTVLAAEPLIFEQAVREAALHNPVLRAARETVNQAQDEVKKSLAEFMPHLAGNAGVSKSQTIVSGGTASDSKSISAGVSVRQSLFAGLKNKGTWNRQQALLAVQLADYRQAATQLRFDLRRAFITVLYGEKRLELSKKIRDRRQQNVRLVQLRFEGGREHKGSFLRSRAAYRQAVFDVSESERDLQVAKKNLSRLLGRETDDGLDVTGELGADAPPAAPDFNRLVSETPLYNQAAMRVKASEAGLVVAKSPFYPDLSATGSVSREGDRFPLDTDRWSAGVSLSYPIFSGGGDRAGLQSSRSQLREQKANLAETRNQVALSLEEAYYGFESAVERIDVQRDFLEAATTRAEIARSQYANGLLSFEDWDLIENDLIQRETEMLTTLRDSGVAAADWDRAQGKGEIQ